ncbi:MAG: GGDEF domain-containing protein [Idiomarina sp.]|nr:GGDEF domain-containing protein [Idiomarina sp.]
MHYAKLRVLPAKYLLLVALCWTYAASAESPAELRDQSLEQALDQTLGIGMAPANRQALSQVLEQVSATTPLLTRVRALTYQALALAIADERTDEALGLLYDMLAEPQIKSNILAKAEVQNTIGEIYLHRRNQQGLAILVPELELQADHIDDPRVRYHRMHVLARSYEIQHVYELSLQYLLNAHEALLELDDQHTQRRRQFLNLHQARILAHLRDFDSALALLNRTIEDSQRHGLSARLPELYMVRGYVIQSNGGPIESAEADFIRATEPVTEGTASRTQMLALNNLGAIHLHTQRYASASDYFQQGIAIAERLNNNYEIHIMRFNVGFVLVKQGEHEQGLTLMRTAVDEFKEVGPLNSQADMLGFLAEAYRDAGDIERELATTRSQLQLREQAFSQERERMTSELQVRYEAQDSALRIQLLEHESALREALLSSQQRQRNWLTVIGLLLAVGLIMALLGSRHVRRLNAQLNQVNSDLQEQSNRDPLTQLYNRRALNKFPKQQGDLIVLIDLDHFKDINDTYGHEAGDKVLISIGERLQKALRAEDLVIRWGGEEFLAVVRNVSPGDIEQVIGKIREAVTQAPNPGIAVNASGGAVLITSQTHTWQAAIHRADTLLYKAKSNGRGHILGEIDGRQLEWR